VSFLRVFLTNALIECAAIVIVTVFEITPAFETACRAIARYTKLAFILCTTAVVVVAFDADSWFVAADP